MSSSNVVFLTISAMGQIPAKGRIKASVGPSAVPKMQAPPPMGTHFCFYHAYCVYQKSVNRSTLVNISVATQ